MATRAHQEVGCAAVLPRQPPFCVRPSQSYLSPAEEGEDLTVLGSSPNKSNLTEAKNGGQGAQDILEGSLDKGRTIYPFFSHLCIKERCLQGRPPSSPWTILTSSAAGRGLQEEACRGRRRGLSALDGWY